MFLFEPPLQTRKGASRGVELMKEAQEGVSKRGAYMLFLKVAYYPNDLSSLVKIVLIIDKKKTSLSVTSPHPGGLTIRGVLLLFEQLLLKNTGINRTKKNFVLQNDEKLRPCFT